MSQKVIHLIALVLTLLIVGQNAYGEEITDLVANANRSYEAGDFLAARTAYEKAITSGATSGHLYYNLGNTYFRLGEIGRAIANLRRAHRELPRDPDVLANLELARTHATDTIGSDTAGLNEFLSRLLILNRHFSPYEMRLVAFWLYGAFWIAFVIDGIVKRSWARGLLVLILVLCCGWSWSTFAIRESRDGTPVIALSSEARAIHPGVIASPEVKVYSGNSTTFQVVFLLHDGAEVEVGEQRDDWVELILPDGKRGWVKENEIEIL